MMHFWCRNMSNADAPFLYTVLMTERERVFFMHKEDSASYMQISRGALWKNAETVCRYVGVPVIGVVKCDGYGVSIGEAARAWQQAGVTMFAVSRPQEALDLRKAGFREDILLMSPVAEAAVLHTLAEHNIILTVTGLDAARFYGRYGEGASLRVHVAVDTGMGRFGVPWTDMDQLKAIYGLSGFRFEGIFSHFSKSFEKTYRQTRRQLTRFLEAADALTSAGYDVGIRHIANSCAALRFPETRLDAVRVGSALVGKLCGAMPVSLQPVARFRAQVVDCKTFQPGDTTGYASVCKIKRHTKAIVVAVGYENGLGYIKRPGTFGLREMLCYLLRLVPQSLRRPCVTWGDHRLPLIGRIGNQFTLFDATDVDIRPGEYVFADVPLLFPHHRRIFVADQ